MMKEKRLSLRILQKRRDVQVSVDLLSPPINPVSRPLRHIFRYVARKWRYAFPHPKTVEPHAPELKFVKDPSLDVPTPPFYRHRPEPADSLYSPAIRTG